jgi:hypothetical protein
VYVQPYSVFLSGLARLADVCCMASSTACVLASGLVHAAAADIAHVQQQAADAAARSTA